MIYQLLLTVGIIAALMIGYYLVQQALRRVSPEIGGDRDVLETRWGCGHCASHDQEHCMLHGTCEHETETGKDDGLQQNTRVHSLLTH